MCPCPICATIAILLAPFLGYKWAKKKLSQHHKHCACCQKAEHQHCLEEKIECTCEECKKDRRLHKKAHSSSLKKKGRKK